MKEESIPRTPEDYDRIVSAVLPDPDRHPAAQEMVEKCMVHGPCGALNPKAPCMKVPSGSTEGVNVQEGIPEEVRCGDGRRAWRLVPRVPPPGRWPQGPGPVGCVCI